MNPVRSIILKLEAFDMHKTLDCGQCFRWQRDTVKEIYIGVVDKTLLVFHERTSELFIYGNDMSDHEIIKYFFKEEEISWHHGKDIYQIEINAKDNIYLIKIVLIGFQSELIITNPTYWCINNDPGEWRRSSKPKLVPRTKAFLEYQTNSSKPITKIALIYPGVNNISRYLNESDVELVNYRKAVNGILFVRLSELKDFFAGQD